MRWTSVLMLLLCARPGVAQDKTAEAMRALNVVLPRDVEMEFALSGAPRHLRAGAAVYVFGKAGFERVRASSNGFTCLVNRDAFFYGASTFKPTCWDARGEQTYVPVMLKVGEMLAAGATYTAIANEIDAGFKTRRFKAPDSGGVAYMLAGDVLVDGKTGRITEQLFPGHYMFYAVGSTSAQLGFDAAAAKDDATLPSVFSGGAGGKHGLSYIIAVPSATHR